MSDGGSVPTKKELQGCQRRQRALMSVNISRSPKKFTRHRSHKCEDVAMEPKSIHYYLRCGCVRCRDINVNSATAALTSDQVRETSTDCKVEGRRTCLLPAERRGSGSSSFGQEDGFASYFYAFASARIETDRNATRGETYSLLQVRPLPEVHNTGIEAYRKRRFIPNISTPISGRDFDHLIEIALGARSFVQPEC